MRPQPRRPSFRKPRSGHDLRPGRGRFSSPSAKSSKSPPFRYFLFNKPYGVLTRFTDTQGRPTLADYIHIPGVYPVGRLDADSEGLLLLTDDGPLAHRLTDPRFDHPKTYLAQVERIPNEESLDTLRRGVLLSDGPCKPAEVELLPEDPPIWERSVPIRFRKNVPTAWIRLTIREGRNRQVRRMTAAVGHPCLRLVRESIGPVNLGGLAPGEHCEISLAELSGHSR